jgi:hypothetical protein
VNFFVLLLGILCYISYTLTHTGKNVTQNTARMDEYIQDFNKYDWPCADTDERAQARYQRLRAFFAERTRPIDDANRVLMAQLLTLSEPEQKQHA